MVSAAAADRSHRLRPSRDTLRRIRDRPRHIPGNGPFCVLRTLDCTHRTLGRTTDRPARRTVIRAPFPASPTSRYPRSCGPTRCSAPSFSHPARAGRRWRNVRTPPCTGDTPRYNLRIFRGTYLFSVFVVRSKSSAGFSAPSPLDGDEGKSNSQPGAYRRARRDRRALPNS